MPKGRLAEVTRGKGSDAGFVSMNPTLWYIAAFIRTSVRKIAETVAVIEFQGLLGPNHR
jgi:hypothetical protein